MMLWNILRAMKTIVRSPFKNWLANNSFQNIRFLIYHKWISHPCYIVCSFLLDIFIFSCYGEATLTLDELFVINFPILKFPNIEHGGICQSVAVNYRSNTLSDKLSSNKVIIEMLWDISVVIIQRCCRHLISSVFILLYRPIMKYWFSDFFFFCMSSSVV